MRNVRLGALVVALGLFGLKSDAEAAPIMDSGFCARCTDAYGCGLEEALCAAWNCDVGLATCSEFGACSGARRLIVCNVNDA